MSINKTYCCKAIQEYANSVKLYKLKLLIIIIRKYINNLFYELIGCGTATHYWLEGPGIESPARKRFSAPSKTAPGAHTASCTVGTGSLSRGVKRPGRGVDHSPPI